MRNGQPGDGDSRASNAAHALAARAPRDDFFCWKFRVWYNLDDCVFRHVHRTTHDCADCEQGAGNVRLVSRTPDAPRWVRLLSVDDFDAARAGNGRP